MKVGRNLLEHVNTKAFPHMWCPGCGHGNAATALATTFDNMGLDPEQVVMVGGIGCASRLPFYMSPSAIHTTHGRALSFATGLKLSRPELTVIIVVGDGDGLAIGGNHLIHACRRNIDMTMLILNNNIYGMTGGQLAPTTPTDFKSTTSMSGNIEPSFDTVNLVLGAGGTFAARTTTFDFQDIPARIEEAIRHPGFAVVEIMSQCTTYFGRLNRLGEAREMLDYERDITEPVPIGERLTAKDVAGTLPLGVFRGAERAEYTQMYADLVKRAKGKAHA